MPQKPPWFDLTWFTTPAPEDQIDAVAAELGVPLPDDLVAWWRLAGGAFYRECHTYLLPRGHLALTPADALRERAELRELMYYEVSPEADASGLAGSATEVFGSLFLPVAFDHGDTNLFVDLRPGPQRGCVMEFDVETTVEGVLWPSVTAMLAETAQALTDGVPVQVGRFAYVPVVQQDGFMVWNRVDSQT